MSEGERPLTIQRAVFEAKNRLRPGALRHYQSLIERASWGRPRLDDYAARQVRELLLLATSRAPFYADHLGQHALEGMPILTRQDLIRDFEAFRVEGVRRGDVRLASTGGTTGEPVSILQDRRNHVEAVGWRVLRPWGVHPGDSMAIINRTTRTRGRSLVNAAMWFPTRHTLLDAASMDPDSMRRFADALVDHPHPVLVGYAGAVYEFVSFLAEQGIKIPPPVVTWTTASPLTETQRGHIEEWLKCPVLDQYGSMEINWIAAECPERAGLHVQADCRVVEIVDESGLPVEDGKEGRILVTDLLNRAFPLIRYEIGDRGRFLLGGCPCGSAFPRLDRIKGRISDAFHFSDGSIIGGEYLTTIFDDVPSAVVKFRVHQTAPDRVILFCVPSDSDSAVDEIEAVAEALSRRIGSRASVTLHLVQQIDHYRGKDRLVVSDV